MRNTEIAHSKVTLDASQAESALKDLEKKAKQAKDALAMMKIGDPGYANQKRIVDQYTTKVNEAARANFNLDRILKTLSGSTLRDLQKAQRQLTAEIRNSSRATDEDRKALAAKTESLKKVNAEITKVKGVTSTATKSSGGLAAAFRSLLPALSVAAVIGFFVNVGRQVFSLQSKFQTFKAVLTSSLGSSGAAAASLKMIQDFAAKTPFSVEQLTGAFVKLVNRGFKPTSQEMTKLGDLASFTGKSFDMLVEAILDAETGEFERLKEFGVKAKVSGDQVTFAFRGTSTVIDNNAESIRKYLLGLGETNGVMGSMAAISETLQGKTSNLGDAFSNFLLTLGRSSSGVFSDVITGLTNIVNAAELAVRSLAQIREEAEISNASENVKESIHEIEVMTASLVRNGVKMADARKQAYELYKAERNKQINDLGTDIGATGAQLKSYEGSNLSGKDRKAVGNLLNRKSELESRRRMLQDEIDQVKALKDAEINYNTEIKKTAGQIEKQLGPYAKLTEQIGNLEQRIRDLSAAGKEIPNDLLHQLTAKKTELSNIDEYLKSIGESIGSLAARNVNPAVKSTGTRPAPGKRAVNIPAPGPEHKDTFGEKIGLGTKEEQWQYGIQQATVASDTIFSIVSTRQQAEYDHKISLLDKQREAELSNQSLTAEQRLAIEDKYNLKQKKLKTEAFKKQRAADLIQAAINTALAITNALTTGGPAAPAMAIAAGIAGAAQGAIIAAQPIPEFAKGRYRVTGESGHTYSADYAGPAVTGYYRRPAIVGENGTEMIIDNPTLRNLQINFPGILNAIQSARIRQYGGGSYPNAADAGMSPAQNLVLLKMVGAVAGLTEKTAALDATLKAGITSTVTLWDLEKMQQKRNYLNTQTNL